MVLQIFMILNILQMVEIHGTVLFTIIRALPEFIHGRFQIPYRQTMVRVTDNVSSCKTDKSDYVFTISSAPASITLTSPNGENLSTAAHLTILHGLRQVLHKII